MAASEKLDISKGSDTSRQGVSLVVYGTQGVTGPVELGKDAPGKFQPGQTEIFKVSSFSVLSGVQTLLSNQSTSSQPNTNSNFLP